MFHTVCCDTDYKSYVSTGEHEPTKHIHTVHHHHIQKQTFIKKIEVPVIKEVKVPFYIYEAFKAPYPYFVHPYIVKVPIEYHDEEKHEDVHHPAPEMHEEHGEDSGHEEEGEEGAHGGEHGGDHGH